MASTEQHTTDDLTPADEQLVRERLAQVAAITVSAPTQAPLRTRLGHSCRGALVARLERAQR